MKNSVRDMSLMDVGDDNIVLFHPHVPESAVSLVQQTLTTRWIGQGPKVDEFEQKFGARFGEGRTAIAVGSGTDALHLSYILAGIEAGDEVITPVFTCAATNIPLLYQKAEIKFADVQPGTLNIDPSHVKQLISDRTKAIVCVHYGGLPCDLNELSAIAAERGIPIIEDAAHALGGTYNGKPVGSISEFSMFSFQAIKQLTTGDGGMLVLKDGSLAEKARRIRWFGIDRVAKQMGNWDNDITEIGYKYQMNDIAAAMGLSALAEFDGVLALRQKLFRRYSEQLQGTPGLQIVGDGYTDREHAAWIFTVIAEDRPGLQAKLRAHHIESNQVHYRNDRYTVFGGRRNNLPNMDAIEEKYLVLPLHPRISIEQVDKICDVIRSGW
ncbi:DegT/DnrJ/EryC1/StrS family aminotransferase [Geomobilimonas luticola]|uniref:DegT/DnrJ/EryC1/StrS family aminotransferase n=1 Tax=Geomobilimonas luticola TaxID=1114878 RepID=A0ABS5SEP9_9BACT|nr:DegT/DnrJ/EryC1/StrS family aminotransferase [Geomobilimonas luticola]MBT0653844.1 DegT/DnrJ/EryC1/StrS family aminotransferase [Geomobilimonas luticola]